MKDPKRGKAYNRAQDRRRKNKTIRKWADFLFEHDWDNENEKLSWIGRTASHNHSCGMCGDHRKFLGLTLKERIAVISTREQLEEI